MILINLLNRRFDNLFRTISEIVVSAIREREKQDKKSGVVSTEINNDKIARTGRKHPPQLLLAAAIPSQDL
jgi:hypothetical protein